MIDVVNFMSDYLILLDRREQGYKSRGDCNNQEIQGLQQARRMFLNLLKEKTTRDGNISVGAGANIHLNFGAKQETHP